MDRYKSKVWNTILCYGNIAVKISKKYPELKNEINYLFEDNYLKNLSLGISSNILKKVNKEI